MAVVLFSGTGQEVADHLGINSSNVRRRSYRQGSGVVRVAPNLYQVVSTEEAVDEADLTENEDAEAPDDADCFDILREDYTASLAGTSGFINRETYRYDISRDEYTFTVKRGGSNVLSHVSGAEIRSWFEYYTTPGVRVADILRKFEIDRQTFLSIKSSLALTKSSLGFTDEELAAKAKDDLIRSSLRKKEREVVIESSRQYQRVLESQARKTRNSESLIRDAFAEIELPKLPPFKSIRVDTDRRDYVLVVPVADYHIGKHSYANSNYTLRDQISEYEALTDRLIDSAVSTWGYPSAVAYAMIGDFFHVDTDKQQTTSQRNNLGESMICTAHQMVKEGTEFATWQIRRLNQLLDCPVWFYSAPGNHDRLLHGALSVFLRMLFADSDWFCDGRELDVESEYYEESNHVIANIASACILFTHTDELNDSAAVSYLNRFRARDVLPENCAVIGGDKHRLNIKDVVGIRRYICGSPSPIDSWHSSKGFVANRETTVFRVPHENVGISDIKIVRLPKDLSNSGHGRVVR